MPDNNISAASGLTPMPEMSVVGYVVALGCLLILLPLLPVAIVAWVVLKVFGRGDSGPVSESGDVA